MLQKDTRPLLTKQSSLKTILVIDDDDTITEFLTLTMSSEIPLVALVFVNGYEALQALKDIVPDLILLDYHLPEIDGLAFYDLLRSIKGQEETPVVFLSASTPLDSMNEIGQREVVLVEKPFELNDLLDVIQYTLTKS